MLGAPAAVIDGHDREVIGYEFALRGRRVKPSEPSRSVVCALAPSVHRADPVSIGQRLIFQSRRFRQACTPTACRRGRHALHAGAERRIERFFRSLNEECAWLTTSRPLSTRSP